MKNYKPEILKIQITNEGIKPVNDDIFRGEILNNSNYKIYILKDESQYVYVGKTKQGIGTKFGQGFSAYLKDEKVVPKQNGYAGYKWIKEYVNTNTELDLFVFDLENDNDNENTEAIEAELAYLIRNKYNMWPSYQNEIHFNNKFDDALEKEIHSGRKQGQLTETKTFYLEYWAAMKSYFETNGTKLNHQKPQPQHWMNFAIGKSYFNMASVASVRDNFNRIELDINGPDATNRFLELKNKYEQDSYNQISKSLVWDVLEGKQMSAVFIRKDADISNRNKWEEQFKWIMETLEKFDAFFRPKIKAIS